jgi:hypothetical protein
MNCTSHTIFTRTSVGIHECGFLQRLVVQINQELQDYTKKHRLPNNLIHGRKISI